MVTFLQLSPEFGGTKFGPFTGIEIRLGSDPGSSDITLPETLGVIPQHVKLLKQQDESFILAPVDRAAPLYHFRGDTGEPKLVTSPLAVVAGDSFSLVTPHGPRFLLVVAGDPKAIAAGARESEGPGLAGRGAHMQRGVLAEIQRRGFAAVFTSRLGNMFMRGWQMVKTGQIFSPIYIVSGMLLLAGWFGAGGTACAALNFKRQSQATQVKLSDCKDQCGISQGGDGTGDPTVPELTRTLLEDVEWQNTMHADSTLYAAYARQLDVVFSQPERYRWVYTSKNSQYRKFSEALTSKSLPPHLVRVLAFAAATPNRAGSTRAWSKVNDSDDREVCGRGALALTYRQARNLGLSVQPDALVDSQVAASGDIALQRSALEKTMSAAGPTSEFKDDGIQSDGAALQGGMQCLSVAGDDERDDLKAVAGALKRTLGKKVPDEGSAFWIASRLVMLFAQDFKATNLEGLSFDARTPPSVAMDNADVLDSRRNFAVQGAAQLMARAAAVPCLARFDKDQREVPEWFMKKPPRLGSCAILKAYVEYGRL